MIIIAKEVKSIIKELVLRNVDSGNELFNILSTREPKVSPREFENMCIDERWTDEPRAKGLRDNYEIFLKYPPYTEMEAREFAEKVLASIIKPESEIKPEPEIITKTEYVYIYPPPPRYTGRNDPNGLIRWALRVYARDGYSWKEVSDYYWDQANKYFIGTDINEYKMQIIKKNESTNTNQSSN